MKKIPAAILVAAAILMFAPNAYADDAPRVSAQAYVVMEAGTGQLLAQKNPDARMLIASTTKIMTALVVLERLSLDEKVTIDPAWTAVDGSSIYLKAGEVCTVETLLYGMMLESGNDAATALACYTAGSVEEFSALMNRRADMLGCNNTHFENPNGLDGATHYSSALDLALITRQALKNQDFCRIVSCRDICLEGRYFHNHNRLLSSCPGTFGVKTGYTMAAGRTLVSCCERNGMTLLCVTLSDPNDWADHAALYDWAYAAYTTENALPEDTAFTLPIVGGTCEDVGVLPEGTLGILRGRDAEVTVQYNLPQFAYAGVYAGQTAGTAVVYVDGVQTGFCRLVYTEAVPWDPNVRLSLGEKLLRFFEQIGRNVYQLS